MTLETERAAEQLRQVLAAVQAADSKANMLGVYYTAVVTALLLRIDIFWKTVSEAVLPWRALAGGVLLSVCLVLFVISMIRFIRAVKPRFKPTARFAGRLMPSLFWYDIASVSLEEFTAANAAATDEQARLDTIRQVHTNSRIAAEKYSDVRACYSLLPWLVVSLLGFVATTLQ